MTDTERLRQIEDLQRKAWPAHVPREPLYPHGEVPLFEYLRAWARSSPDRVAIQYYGAAVTYAELDDLSDRCAALLASHGVGAGDRVAVVLGNCPQFVIVFYAILKLGAVYVPVNPMFKAEELVYELNDSGASCAVVLDRLASLLRSVQARTPVTTVFSTGQGEMLPAEPLLPVPAELVGPPVHPEDTIDLLPAVRECRAPVPAAEIGLDTLAALNYTGGTTGVPKGCMHTHGDILYTAACGYATSGAVLADGTRVTEGPEVHLCFIPLFWIAGEDLGLLNPVFGGDTLVLLARWNPGAVLAATERYAVTQCFLLVDNVRELLEHPDVRRHDLRSLQHARTASFVRKLTTDVRRSWQELTGGSICEIGWGLTETNTADTFSTGMWDDDQDLKGRPIFVGLPVPGTTIKICDFDSGELVPIGAEGEIVVRTPSLFKGYWERPEATAEAIRDGWLHTGDIGAYDADGYLHYLGRRKEMLKVRGMSVFPSELEEMLARHPAVLGSAVVGRPDSEKGQVPVAFIRLRPEHVGRVSDEALHAWCIEQMATYKVPEVRLVDELPLTTSGKVRKVDLEAQLEAEARVGPGSRAVSAPRRS